MSRFDGKLDAAGEALVAPAELLRALAGEELKSEQERHDAIARCLSASDGWEEAGRKLRGAFAPEVARGRGNAG